MKEKYLAKREGEILSLFNYAKNFKWEYNVETSFFILFKFKFKLETF